MTQTDAVLFRQAVEAAQTIFATAHVGPDGDTLGSMLGLRHALTQAFPHIQTFDCVITGEIPYQYTFMPGIDAVKNVETATDLLPQYDLAFSVDCGSADRLGPAKAWFLSAKHSLNIDHHISNTRFGKVNIIDVNAGASGQVVADLLNANGIAIPAEAAIALYVAVVTDTGGFKYSSTTPQLFELAAQLTQCGANPEVIYRHIYESVPKKQVLLQAKALQQAQFNADSTLGWTSVTQAMLTEFGALDEHIEGLVEAIRRIDTVQVSAVLKETKDGQTKASLRSDNHSINVADVAAKWGGGGHKMAAGFTAQASPQELAKTLVPLLEDVIRQAR